MYRLEISLQWIYFFKKVNSARQNDWRKFCKWTISLKGIRDQCFGYKKRNTTIRQAKTGIAATYVGVILGYSFLHIFTRRRVVIRFFQPETTVAIFLHLIVSIFKVFIIYFLKSQFVVLFVAFVGRIFQLKMQHSIAMATYGFYLE